MRKFLARNGASIGVLFLGLILRLPFVPVGFGAVGDLYAFREVTFFFNLITVIPFTPLFGTNLIAAEPLTFGVVVLKFVALVAAALNVIALLWLLYKLILVPKRSLPVAGVRMRS